MFLVDTGYTKPLLVIGGIAFPNDLEEPLRFLCTGVSVHPPNRLFFNARLHAIRFKLRGCFYLDFFKEILFLSRLESSKTARIWGECIPRWEHFNIPIVQSCQSIGCFDHL
jgi:hypothetical protein